MELAVDAVSAARASPRPSAMAFTAPAALEGLCVVSGFLWLAGMMHEDTSSLASERMHSSHSRRWSAKRPAGDAVGW